MVRVLRQPRLGEKTIQKIGLAAPSNDANTGDIVQPWNSFVHMRDGLKDIQAQVGHRLQQQYLPACNAVQCRTEVRCSAGEVVPQPHPTPFLLSSVRLIASIVTPYGQCSVVEGSCGHGWHGSLGGGGGHWLCTPRILACPCTCFIFIF